MASVTLGHGLQGAGGCAGMCWDFSSREGGTAQPKDDCLWEQQNRALVMVWVQNWANRTSACETIPLAPASQALWLLQARHNKAFVPLFLQHLHSGFLQTPLLLFPVFCSPCHGLWACPRAASLFLYILKEGLQDMTCRLRLLSLPQGWAPRVSPLSFPLSCQELCVTVWLLLPGRQCISDVNSLQINHQVADELHFSGPWQVTNYSV